MTTGLTLPWLPPAEIVRIDGRGEFFARHHRHPDPDAPTLVLVHGWTASADLQFFTAYRALADHYSFLAIDHRGHGRGLRTATEFTLDEVADDAVVVAHALGIRRAIVVGYSMGGPITLTLARRHRDFVEAAVLGGTALEWRATWRERIGWKLLLPTLGMVLRSRRLSRRSARFLEKFLPAHHPLHPYVPWLTGEVRRGDVDAIVQAGRAIGGYDARAWAPDLGVRTAVLLTTEDRLVKPKKQRALAAAMDAPIREVHADHLAPWEAPDQFASVLLELVGLVAPPS